MNLNTLPRYGVLRIYATVDRITEESAAEGDAAERGWVSQVGSAQPFIYDSRNEVDPVFEARIENGKLSTYFLSEAITDETHAEALEEIAELINSLGAIESDDGSTIYAADPVINSITGDYFNYALHSPVKQYVIARGYVEDEVDELPA
jgi:hypothetical protein